MGHSHHKELASNVTSAKMAKSCFRFFLTFLENIHIQVFFFLLILNTQIESCNHTLLELPLSHLSFP